MGKEITWTLPMLRRFKRALDKAQSEVTGCFEFEGNLFNLSYAKYLTGYLTTLLTEKK